MKKEYLKKSGDVKDVEVVAKEPKVFANLTYDKGFKIVLGTEGKSERLLRSLLNELLSLKITDLTFIPTEKLGRTEDEGESFFDVYCKDEMGRRFLIEMQLWNQTYYPKRALYYMSLAIQDQARQERERQKKVGKKWNYYFPSVYEINFLNYPNSLVNPSPDIIGPPFVSGYTFKNELNIELGDGAKLVFVDLERFSKSFEECNDSLEQWLFSIKNMHTLNKRPDGIDGTDLEALYREADLAVWPAQERSNYERYMGHKDDFLLYVQEQEEAALDKGIAIGREEGREEGERIGKLTANRETARKLLELGLDIHIISSSTGLSVEEIGDLQ